MIDVEEMMETSSQGITSSSPSPNVSVSICAVQFMINYLSACCMVVERKIVRYLSVWSSTESAADLGNHPQHLHTITVKCTDKRTSLVSVRVHGVVARQFGEAIVVSRADILMGNALYLWGVLVLVLLIAISTDIHMQVDCIKLTDICRLSCATSDCP